jgi:hypothetical protein
MKDDFDIPIEHGLPFMVVRGLIGPGVGDAWGIGVVGFHGVVFLFSIHH